MFTLSGAIELRRLACFKTVFIAYQMPSELRQLKSVDKVSE